MTTGSGGVNITGGTILLGVNSGAAGSLVLGGNVTSSTAAGLIDSQSTTASTVSLNGATRDFNVTSSSLSVNANITGSGVGINKKGAGTLNLNGANSYSGTTDIQVGTLALGHFTAHPAAEKLDEKCQVPAALLEMPFGLTNTDRFIHALCTHGGVDVPGSLGEERGRLLDAMGDMHQYFHGKTVAVALGPRDWDNKAAHEVVDSLLLHHGPVGQR